MGTHDVALVGRIESDARVRDVGRDAFEVAMLFGIRASDQVRLAREGFVVRTLISYGSYLDPGSSAASP